MSSDLEKKGKTIMLAFLCGVSIVATSLVFLGGAVAGHSMPAGLLIGGIGGAWLGVLYGTLIQLASRDSSWREPSNGRRSL